MPTNFLNLPDWEVLDVKTKAHDYRVEARYTVQPTVCPHCHQGGLFGSLYRHGSKEQLLMDLPSHGKRVGIVIKRPRYRCRNCGKTFPQPLPDVDERSSLTKRLVAFIEQESIRRTFTSIADDVGVNEKTVRNIFAVFVAYLDENATFETPEWLGIDEVHLLRKPRCVITNVKERTIIGVLENRNKPTVNQHLKSLNNRDRIAVVTMDMWKPYRDAVRKQLPKAVIVIDKFHVVRMASQAMDSVRKKVRGDLTPAQRRKLMHDRFILLRRSDKLKPEQVVKRDEWLAIFPALKDAYWAKEAFYAIYEEEAKTAALESFQAWRDSLSTATAMAFKPLLTATTNWNTEIFAYFDHRAANACTEALNGIAKHINRGGRGYSFAAIRAKMLYSKTLQKERREPYTGQFDATHGLPEPGEWDYFGHRDEFTDDTLLGTDLMALWTYLDPASVVKANGKGRYKSTGSGIRLHEEE